MTGAEANTGWLNGRVALDAQGFIKTGPDLTHEDLAAAQWPLERSPYLLETSHPGVFAVGDVRCGNVRPWHRQSVKDRSPCRLSIARVSYGWQATPGSGPSAPKRRSRVGGPGAPIFHSMDLDRMKPLEGLLRESQ